MKGLCWRAFECWNARAISLYVWKPPSLTSERLDLILTSDIKRRSVSPRQRTSYTLFQHADHHDRAMQRHTQFFSFWQLPDRDTQSDRQSVSSSTLSTSFSHLMDAIRRIVSTSPPSSPTLDCRHLKKNLGSDRIRVILRLPPHRHHDIPF